jgi:Uma2 family endonuclease
MEGIMSSAATQSDLTPEAYLALERKAKTKSEYFNGQIYAMSGASRAHNLIGGNIFGGLHAQLRERDCEVYTNDMRVKVSPTGLYTYPDVVVVCDEPRFEDDVFDTLLNPIVLIEVLSPSTEAYDRGEKFAHYRQIASLQEYVLVSQDRISVEHYLRQGTQWLLTEFCGLQEVLSLISIRCELHLSDIYRRITFSEESTTLTEVGE